MAKPADTCHADQLCTLVGATVNDGNRMLAELARQCRREAVRAPDPPFVFVTAPGQPWQAISALQFHPPYALALATVELTLYGYCVQRTSVWERRSEAVFRLGRPPLWRRLWRPAPLLALKVGSAGGVATVSVGAAGPRAGTPGGQRRTILLAPEVQEALLRLQDEHLAARSFRKKIFPW
jgi:hypothetical protein